MAHLDAFTSPLLYPIHVFSRFSFLSMNRIILANKIDLAYINRYDSLDCLSCSGMNAVQHVTSMLGIARDLRRRNESRPARKVYSNAYMLVFKSSSLM